MTVDENAGVPSGAPGSENGGHEGGHEGGYDSVPYAGAGAGSGFGADSGSGYGDGAGYGDGPGYGDGSRAGHVPPVAPPPTDKSTLVKLLVPFAAVWRFAFPKKPRAFLVELPFLLAIALVLAFLIKTFLVQAFVIPSGSMQNTLEINDRVLVNRLANWMGDKPARGDVVVFQDPGGWLDNAPVKPANLIGKTLTAIGLLPEDNGDLIKRVIGLPGDHVACKGSGFPVTVNGVSLDETSYLYPDNQPSMDAFDVVVPAGHLWVMGDHRAVSEDSRPHEAAHKGGGMVPISNVVGHAVLKVWPPSRIGTVPVPATFSQSAISAVEVPGVAPAASLALALPITLVRRGRRLRKLTARR